MTSGIPQIASPIFLVGFPRSGTTFLQSLLATQIGVVTFPETHFYSVVTGHLDTSKGIPVSSLTDVVERATSYLELNANEQAVLKNIDNKSGYIERRSLFEKIIEILCHSQAVTIRKGQVLLEKTPSHAFHLEKIAQDFPDLRVIHLTRHPVDSISSYQKHLSKGDKSISDLIKEWIRSHNSVEKFAKNYPDKIYQIQYENLKADRVSEMDKLMSWLGIEHDFEKMKLYASKASEYIMSFEPWKGDNTEDGFKQSKNSLSIKDKAEIQFLLASKMQKEGYKLRSPILQRLYNFKNGGAR